MTKTIWYAAVAAKLLLLALLLAALIWPDLSGIKGKASTARLIVYPIGALVLPLWWWIRGRRACPEPSQSSLPSASAAPRP